MCPNQNAERKQSLERYRTEGNSRYRQNLRGGDAYSFRWHLFTMYEIYSDGRGGVPGMPPARAAQWSRVRHRRPDFDTLVSVWRFYSKRANRYKLFRN